MQNLMLILNLFTIWITTEGVLFEIKCFPYTRKRYLDVIRAYLIYCIYSLILLSKISSVLFLTLNLLWLKLFSKFITIYIKKYAYSHHFFFELL